MLHWLILLKESCHMTKEFEVEIPVNYKLGKPIKIPFKFNENIIVDGFLITKVNKQISDSYLLKVGNGKWPLNIKLANDVVIKFKNKRNFLKEEIIKKPFFYEVEKKQSGFLSYVVLFFLILCLMSFYLIKSKYVVQKVKKIKIKKLMRQHIIYEDFVKLKKILDSQDFKSCFKDRKEFENCFNKYAWSKENKNIKTNLMGLLNDL